ASTHPNLYIVMAPQKLEKKSIFSMKEKKEIHNPYLYPRGSYLLKYDLPASFFYRQKISF
ncbi:hypothetical protein HMPREF9554_02243, partial [Treponema phagedenis F0421]|uniref:hypothetical protein n=1 Tax=Treponema phagedenis TaxID=162 RepID=UPI0001F640AC